MRENQGQVYAAKLRQGVAAAGITERQTGAAQGGLIERDRAATGQGLRDVAASLDEDLARQREPGHRGAGLATDSCFIVEQMDGVTAAAGLHLQAVNRAAQAVVGHAHLTGREADTGTGKQHATFELHRMGAGG